MIHRRVAAIACDIAADLGEQAAGIHSAPDYRQIFRIAAHTIPQRRPTAAIPLGNVIRSCVASVAWGIAADLGEIAADIHSAPTHR